MSLSLLLLWFPIVVAVGAAGRLFGRERGLAFGCICSFFWVALVQTTGSIGAWNEPWNIIAIVLGVVAVTLVGGWSGRRTSTNAGRAPKTHEVSSSPSTTRVSVDRRLLSLIAKALGRFDDWLEDVACSKDPWADFGEYLRSVLFDTLGATHVQPFRVVSDGAQLEPLHRADVVGAATSVAVGEGLIGRVLATNDSYVCGAHDDADQHGGVMESGKSTPAWCFAVMRGTQRLGVVSVGKMDLSPADHPEAAQVLERLIGQVWLAFLAKLDERSARVTDATSMLATRDAFMRDANVALRESYALGEPFAIAVLATQGLRRLTDAGRWEVADDLLHTIGAVIRRKVRLDDCVGRIDESRVVWLLRRVDGDLAKLVVGQLLSHINEAIRSYQGAAGIVHVDCGVTTSHSNELPLRTFLVQALEAARRARVEKQTVFFLDTANDQSANFEQSVSEVS